jgi:hypothetical protein
MNPSKLYVPNPQEWVQFFHKLAQGNVKLGQIGGGNVAQIIPMDQHTSTQANTSGLSLKRVSPAEQTVDQAKSELERENIKPSEVKALFQTPKNPRRYRLSAKRKSNAKDGNRSKKVGRTKKGRKSKKVGKTGKQQSLSTSKKVQIHALKNKRDIFQF